MRCMEIIDYFFLSVAGITVVMGAFCLLFIALDEFYGIFGLNGLKNELAKIKRRKK